MRKKAYFKSVTIFLSILLVFSQLQLFSLPAYGETVSDQPLLFRSVGVAQSGTTYYVDGEGGNNANDGQSPASAWRDFEKVNQTEFQPGDHVLLNAQSTWNNQLLHPKGNGTAAQKIVIDFYDTNDKGETIFETTRRPIINGGGTYSTGTFKRAISGAVQLVNQEYWDISNLEVTNTPELDNLEGYKKPGDAQRAGILVLGYEQNRTFNSVTIRNNYVHDVQTEYYLNLSGNTATKRLKAVGGIIVLGSWFDENGNVVTAANDHRTTTGFNDILIENNVIQRVGLEGIRTKADSDTSRGNTFYKTFSNITIRNNYLEDIAGDGIVLSEAKSGGVVEGNVAVRMCNADYGTQNYAGVWAMSVDDGLFQYNEVYGIKYGFNDAEAYDVDMQSNNVIYQYNYSHHNTGGFLLLMSDQKNSVIRYNISANDGGGNRGTGKDNPGGAGGYNYKEQSIFHYWVKNDGAAMPTIHNNTIYVGDGISTSLFGEGNSSDNSSTVANFYNNILYKEGTGQLKFLSNYPTNGTQPIERKMVDNPEKYFKNNVIWPKEIATEKSGATVEKLVSSGNIFEKPQLEITDNPEKAKELAEQEFTTLKPTKDNVVEFTSKERLRQRAQMFQLKETSPAIGKGLSEVNSAAEDFFGNSLKNKVLDIGAQQASTIEKSIRYQNQVLEISSATGVYPNLPEQAELTYEEVVNEEVVATGKKEFKLQWEAIPQEKINTAGTVEVAATVIGLPIDAVKVTAKVSFEGELGEGKDTVKLKIAQTAYVQKSDGNRAYSDIAGGTAAISSGDAYKYPYGVNYTGNYALKLKNASSAGYNCRIYVEIDTQELKNYQSLKSANLELNVMRYDAWNGAGNTNDERLKNTQFQVDVYGTDTNWMSNTITWNNGPNNLNVPNEEFIARQSFTNSSIMNNQNTISIDISNYLRKLIQSGEKIPAKLSFLLAITDSRLPGYDSDNAGFDAFSKEGAQKAYQDFLAGKLTLPTGQQLTEDSLAPKIVLSNVFEVKHESIEVTTEAGQAPNLPEKTTIFYSDGSQREVTVNWSEVPASSYQKEGTFTVVGRAAGVSMPIIANVKVTAKHIVGFKELPTLDRLTGTSRGELNLPTEVIAKLDDGSETKLKVISWDDDVSNYSPSSPPGTYQFPAAVEEKIGIANPDERKIFQVVQTHAIPERIQFATETATIKSGENYQIQSKVIGQAPHTETDAWSSQVTYELVTPDAGNTVSVDENGLIRTEATTAAGNYQIKVTSKVLPVVTAQFSIKVTK